MNPIKIVAIVGMPGAGKTVTADFFRSKNIPVLRFGDQTDIGLKELHQEKNEKNERAYREKLRQELGMAAMAIKIEPRIDIALKDSDTLVLDGLYSWEEYVYLKEKFPMLQLLCIYSSPRARYARLSKRKIRPLTLVDAQSRDVAELVHLNKGGPIALADYLIKNDGNEDDFLIELEKFYSDFL